MSSKRAKFEEKSKTPEGLTWTVEPPKDDPDVLDDRSLEIVLRDRDIWSGSAPIPVDLLKVAEGQPVRVRLQILPHDRDIWSKPVLLELRRNAETHTEQHPVLTSKG